MPILKHELRIQRKHLILWLCITGIIIFMMFSEFSVFYKNPEMLDLLKNFPKQLLKLFSIDQTTLTTLSGFLSIASIYIYILGSAFAIILGNNSLSKEERNKTAEFILSLPISREKILLYKWMVGLIQCLTFSVSTFILIFLVSLPYDINGLYLQYLLLIVASLFMIQVIFFTLGMLLATFIKGISKSNAYAVALIIISYLIHLLMEFSEFLIPYKYITPFRFFDSHEMLNQLHLDPCGIGLTLSITLLFLASTFYLYPKRDLPL